ncbi:MAG: DNA-binding transcriptional regulator [Kiritimatiellae bacterium]|nr:DNA-binding transcriptional regulator [Kiritimatiellia bacterium]
MKIAVLTESSSEYGRRLVDGVAAFARATHDWRLTWLNLDAIPQRGAFDGCSGIIARVANDAIAHRLKSTGLPVVDVFCQRSYPGFYGVNSNHEKIGCLAAEHFLAKRHTHFAFVGFRNVAFSDKRRQAFLSALERHGHRVVTREIALLRDQRAFFNTNINPITDKSALESWLAGLHLPIALFAANDLLALNVSRLAHDMGIDIPRQMAILGVDDDRLLCAFAETPISSIDPNAFGIGYAAAQTLSDAMNSPSKKKNHLVLHIAPNGVVTRASTERHAIKPEWLADVLGYIDSSLDRPLSTVDLEAFTGRSHVTLSKAFRENLGMSPLRYITEVKMKAAHALLARGELLVKEVAARVGYPSVSRFSVVYGEFWGHSPRQEKGGRRAANAAC